MGHQHGPVSLFWDTNMVAVTSCENTPLVLVIYCPSYCPPIETVLQMLRQVNKQEIKDFHKWMFFYNAVKLGNTMSVKMLSCLSLRA